MTYTQVLEQLMNQAIAEYLAKEVYRVSTKVVGSVEDFTKTLENARSLSDAANHNIGVAGNSIIMGMGAYTGGNSVIQYGITRNKKAKALYALSTIFSASAIANGSLAVVSRSCNISPTACMSESLGFAFMKLGNKVHVIALQLEGKPIPRKLQKYMDPGIRPLSFIKPQDINVIGISGHQILVVISVGFSIYTYRKILVKCYQYGQQFIINYRKNKKNDNFILQVRFTVISLNKCPSVSKAMAIYRFSIG